MLIRCLLIMALIAVTLPSEAVACLACQGDPKSPLTIGARDGVVVMVLITYVLIIGFGWWLTERVVEPRLQGTEIDGDEDDLPEVHDLKDEERKGLRWSLIVMGVGLAVLIVTLLPAESPWRDTNGNLATFSAPIMRSIVALIFFLFLLPGIVFGYVA